MPPCSWSSFAIFAFFGFAPLFVQGALGKSPVEVGTTVLALSLGWSVGSLALGRFVNRWGSRPSAAAGAVFLAAGSGLTLTFSTTTSIAACFWVFGLVGVGMGFVALATILVVQDSVPASDLGVATASHQFFRNLGGTVGIGVCGGIFTNRFSAAVEAGLAGVGAARLPDALGEQIGRNADSLFRPEVQARLDPELLLQTSGCGLPGGARGLPGHHRRRRPLPGLLPAAAARQPRASCRRQKKLTPATHRGMSPPSSA